MTALLAIGSVLGYVVLGFLCSIVTAAVMSAHNKGGYHSGTAEGPVVVLGSIIWPLLLPCIAMYFGFRPAGRVVARFWKWTVLKLNPNYRGLS